MLSPRPLYDVHAIGHPSNPPTWPFHPRPQPDEIAISWLVRLALAYRRTLREFDKEVLGTCIVTREHKGRWSPRIIFDAAKLELALPKLALGTGVGLNELRALFKPPPADHDLSRLAGQAQPVCPVCWAQDGQPYIRKSWTLATTEVCTHHGVLLLDRCRACGLEIRNDAFRWYQKDMAYCRRCGANFRLLPAIAADPDVVAFCRTVEEVCARWAEVRTEDQQKGDRSFVALVRLIEAWARAGDRHWEVRYTSLLTFIAWLRTAWGLLKNVDNALLGRWLIHARACVRHAWSESEWSACGDLDDLRADLSEFSATQCCVPIGSVRPHRAAHVLAVALHLWEADGPRNQLSGMFSLEPNESPGEFDNRLSLPFWSGWKDPAWSKPALKRRTILREVPFLPLEIKPRGRTWGLSDNWLAKYQDPTPLPIATEFVRDNWRKFRSATPIQQSHLVKMVARKLTDRGAMSAAADIFRPPRPRD